MSNSPSPSGAIHCDPAPFPKSDFDYAAPAAGREPPGPTVTEVDVDSAIRKEDYTVLQDGRTTVCLLTLDNNYTVRGESSCVSLANFDAEKGRTYARKDAVRKVWPLLAFRLADRLAAEAAEADPRTRNATSHPMFKWDEELGANRCTLCGADPSNSGDMSCVDRRRAAHEPQNPPRPLGHHPVA